MSLKKQGKYRFDDFEVDLAQRSLRRQGHPIAVSPRTFDLLVYLVLNPQRIVTQEEIMGALWPDTHLEESNLGQHIFLLRKALTSKQPGEKLILRKPGPGYEFAASVMKLDPSLESGEIQRNHIHQLPAANSRIHESLEIPLREPSFFSSRAARAANEADSPDVEENASRSSRTARRKAAVLARRQAEGEKQTEEDSNQESENLNEADHRQVSGFRKTIRDSKPWQLASAAVLILALAAGAWLSWRVVHRAHPDSLSLVVGTLKNNSGEPQFDQALETALTLDLQQSPYLTVASSQRFLQTAAELNLPQESLANSASAAKVCKTLNDHAYLSSTIERFALKYLLTVEAFDCTSGYSLARSKALVSTPDAVLNVLDKVASDLRDQLGEPSSSIARFGKFNKPLFSKGTASLGAIKAYAEASRLVSQSKLQDAIPLYQQALRLDPKMTMATADLGAVYANLGERDLAVSTLTQAYESRDSAAEPIRFFIIATYNRIVTGDLQAGIRNEKEWSQAYPHNPAPLGNLADLQTQIGKPALALEPAKQALAINPNDGLSYILLARAQMHLGQIDEAEKTCNLAIGHKVDDEQIHAFLFEIAYLRLDQPAMDGQIAWAKDKPAEQPMQLELARMNLAMGKVKAAMAILNTVAAEYKDQGDEAEANQILSAAPRAQAELGKLESALALLTRLSQASEDSIDIPVAYAEVGETARALPMLARQLEAHPFDTLLQQYQAPQVRAAVDLVQHRPSAAIDDLQIAIPYDLRAFAVPAMRGKAYLANKQPALAEAEFRKILDHSGIDPLSYDYPLAELGLARALAAEASLDQPDKAAEATFAYKIVLQIWKDADPDLPRLIEAKAEYARLSVPPVAAAKPRLSASTTTKKPSAAAHKLPPKPLDFSAPSP